jgi:hypothetical protein
LCWEGAQVCRIFPQAISERGTQSTLRSTNAPHFTGYDVDSRKVKAETLDGRLCTKKKCKVFDRIVCKM